MEIQNICRTRMIPRGGTDSLLTLIIKIIIIILLYYKERKSKTGRGFQHV